MLGREVSQDILLALGKHLQLSFSLCLLLVGVGNGQCLHQHQFFDHLRLGTEQLQRHIATHRVTNHRSTLHTTLFQNARHHIGHPLHRVHLANHLRDTRAGQIEGDYSVLLFQFSRKVVKHIARGEIAVKEKHSGEFATAICHHQGHTSRQ